MRREFSARRPVEFSRFHHDAAHRIAVPAEELRRRVGDDIRAPFERPAQIRRRQRVIDDQRQARRVRDLRDRRQIDDDAARVGQALDEDRLAPRRQRAAEILRIGRIDEMAGPAELLERQPELRQRAAIQVARRQELVALLQHRREHQELRGMAGRGGDRGAAAFQAGDALLQHRDGGVGQARVDVAEIVQVEERRGVIHVVEHVSRGLVDRRAARAGGRVGRRAGMDRPRLETVGHVVRRHRPRLGAALGRRLGRAVADDAGVHAAPGQLAAQPAEFDLRAAVHDHFEAGRLGLRRRLVVADAEAASTPPWRRSRWRPRRSAPPRRRRGTRPPCRSCRECRAAWRRLARPAAPGRRCRGSPG